MDKVEVLQDINARLQMKMTLNADQAMARESALKSRIAYLEDTALPHARKQEHANGFQAGWCAALTRIEQGDGVEELLDACPTVLPNQDCVIHLPRPDCPIGHAHLIDACGAFEPQAAVRRSGEPGWQPIETAPRDGTEVHAWIPLESAARGGVITPMCFCEGWCNLFTGDYEPDHQPTHWMPLPDPPRRSGEPT